MGILYKLTFSNGKIYIGMSTVSLRKRLYCHRFKARTDNPKLLVHRAWKLHGEPIAEIIATVANEDLPAAEVRAIREFRSFGDGGYNMTPGGEASPMKIAATVEKVRALASTPERIARTKAIHIGSKRSPELCKLFSEMRKGQGLGIPKSPEHRRKISAANKGKNSRLGFRNTEETKLRMSIAAKKRWARESGE